MSDFRFKHNFIPVGLASSAKKDLDMDEQRKSIRYKSFLRGCIYSRNSSASCIVRNVSTEGARVVLSAALNIPELVTLEIPDKMKALSARLRWRRGDELGFNFYETSRLLTPDKISELGERITRLELELASLRVLSEQLGC